MASKDKEYVVEFKVNTSNAEQNLKSLADAINGTMKNLGLDKKYKISADMDEKSFTKALKHINDLTSKANAKSKKGAAFGVLSGYMQEFDKLHKEELHRIAIEKKKISEIVDIKSKAGGAVKFDVTVDGYKEAKQELEGLMKAAKQIQSIMGKMSGGAKLVSDSQLRQLSKIIKETEIAKTRAKDNISKEGYDGLLALYKKIEQINNWESKNRYKALGLDTSEALKNVTSLETESDKILNSIKQKWAKTGLTVSIQLSSDNLALDKYKAALERQIAGMKPRLTGDKATDKVLMKDFAKASAPFEDVKGDIDSLLKVISTLKTAKEALNKAVADALSDKSIGSVAKKELEEVKQKVEAVTATPIKPEVKVEGIEKAKKDLSTLESQTNELYKSINKLTEALGRAPTNKELGALLDMEQSRLPLAVKEMRLSFKDSGHAGDTSTPEVQELANEYKEHIEDVISNKLKHLSVAVGIDNFKDLEKLDQAIDKAGNTSGITDQKQLDLLEREFNLLVRIRDVIMGMHEFGMGKELESLNSSLLGVNGKLGSKGGSVSKSIAKEAEEVAQEAQKAVTKTGGASLALNYGFSSEEALKTVEKIQEFFNNHPVTIRFSLGERNISNRKSFESAFREMVGEKNIAKDSMLMVKQLNEAITKAETLKGAIEYFDSHAVKLNGKYVKDAFSPQNLQKFEAMYKKGVEISGNNKTIKEWENFAHSMLTSKLLKEKITEDQFKELRKNLLDNPISFGITIESSRLEELKRTIERYLEQHPVQVPLGFENLNKLLEQFEKRFAMLFTRFTDKMPSVAAASMSKMDKESLKDQLQNRSAQEILNKVDEAVKSGSLKELVNQRILSNYEVLVGALTSLGNAAKTAYDYMSQLKTFNFRLGVDDEAIVVANKNLQQLKTDLEKGLTFTPTLNKERIEAFLNDMDSRLTKLHQLVKNLFGKAGESIGLDPNGRNKIKIGLDVEGLTQNWKTVTDVLDKYKEYYDKLSTPIPIKFKDTPIQIPIAEDLFKTTITNLNKIFRDAFPKVVPIELQFILPHTQVASELATAMKQSGLNPSNTISRSDMQLVKKLTNLKSIKAFDPSAGGDELKNYYDALRRFSSKLAEYNNARNAPVEAIKGVIPETIRVNLEPQIAPEAVKSAINSNVQNRFIDLIPNITPADLNRLQRDLVTYLGGGYPLNIVPHLLEPLQFENKEILPLVKSRTMYIEPEFKNKQPVDDFIDSLKKVPMIIDITFPDNLVTNSNAIGTLFTRLQNLIRLMQGTGANGNARNRAIRIDTREALLHISELRLAFLDFVHDVLANHNLKVKLDTQQVQQALTDLKNSQNNGYITITPTITSKSITDVITQVRNTIAAVKYPPTITVGVRPSKSDVKQLTTFIHQLQNDLQKINGNNQNNIVFTTNAGRIITVLDSLMQSVSNVRALANQSMNNIHVNITSNDLTSLVTNLQAIAAALQTIQQNSNVNLHGLGNVGSNIPGGGNNAGNANAQNQQLRTYRQQVSDAILAADRAHQNWRAGNGSEQDYLQAKHNFEQALQAYLQFSRTLGTMSYSAQIAELEKLAGSTREGTAAFSALQAEIFRLTDASNRLKGALKNEFKPVTGSLSAATFKNRGNANRWSNNTNESVATLSGMPGFFGNAVENVAYTTRLVGRSTKGFGSMFEALSQFLVDTQRVVGLSTQRIDELRKGIVQSMKTLHIIDQQLRPLQGNDPIIVRRRNELLRQQRTQERYISQASSEIDARNATIDRWAVIGNVVGTMATIGGAIGAFEKAIEVPIRGLQFFGNMLKSVGDNLYNLLKPGIELYKNDLASTFSMTASMMANGFLGGTRIKNIEGGKDIAFGISEKLVRRAMLDAEMSAFSLEEILRSLQGTLPILLNLGMTLEQAYEVNKGVAGVAKMIQLTPSQILQETRDLAQGSITSRGSQVANALGITNQDLAKFGDDAQARFDFLMEKFSTFSELLNDFENTALGRYQQFQERWQTVTKQIVEGVAPLFKTLFEELITMTGRYEDANGNYLDAITGEWKTASGEVIGTIQEVANHTVDFSPKDPEFHPAEIFLQAVDALQDVIIFIADAIDETITWLMYFMKVDSILDLGKEGIKIIVKLMQFLVKVLVKTIVYSKQLVALLSAAGIALGLATGNVVALSAGIAGIAAALAMPNLASGVHEREEEYKRTHEPTSWSIDPNTGQIIENYEPDENNRMLGIADKLKQSLDEWKKQQEEDRKKQRDNKYNLGDVKGQYSKFDAQALKKYIQEQQKIYKDIVSAMKDVLSSSLEELKSIAAQNELDFKQGLKPMQEYYAEKTALDKAEHEQRLQELMIQKELLAQTPFEHEYDAYKEAFSLEKEIRTEQRAILQATKAQEDVFKLGGAISQVQSNVDVKMRETAGYVKNASAKAIETAKKYDQTAQIATTASSTISTNTTEAARQTGIMAENAKRAAQNLGIGADAVANTLNTLNKIRTDGTHGGSGGKFGNTPLPRYNINPYASGERFTKETMDALYAAKPSNVSYELFDKALNAAIAEGIPKDWLKYFLGLIAHESMGWKVNAVSPAGAVGLTQLMPDIARAMGVTDIYDVDQNLRGGAKYFKQQIDVFGNKIHGIEQALAAYNGGPGIVSSYLRGTSDSENQNYPAAVMAEAARYGSVVIKTTTEPLKQTIDKNTKAVQDNSDTTQANTDMIQNGGDIPADKNLYGVDRRYYFTEKPDGRFRLGYDPAEDIGKMQDFAKAGFNALNRLFYDLTGYLLEPNVATSGQHSAGSAHYVGYAIDYQSEAYNPQTGEKVNMLAKDNELATKLVEAANKLGIALALEDEYHWHALFGDTGKNTIPTGLYGFDTSKGTGGMTGAAWENNYRSGALQGGATSSQPSGLQGALDIFKLGNNPELDAQIKAAQEAVNEIRTTVTDSITKFTATIQGFSDFVKSSDFVEFINMNMKSKEGLEYKSTILDELQELGGMYQEWYKDMIFEDTSNFNRVVAEVERRKKQLAARGKQYAQAFMDMFDLQKELAALQADKAKLDLRRDYVMQANETWGEYAVNKTYLGMDTSPEYNTTAVLNRYLEYTYKDKDNPLAPANIIEKYLEEMHKWADLGKVNQAQEIRGKIVEVFKQANAMVEKYLDKVSEYFSQYNTWVQGSRATSLMKARGEREIQAREGSIRYNVIQKALAQNGLAQDMNKERLANLSERRNWLTTAVKIEADPKFKEQFERELAHVTDDQKTISILQNQLEIREDTLKIQRLQAEQQAKLNDYIERTQEVSKQALEDGLVTFLTDGVNEAENLGEALRDLAITWLKTMQKFFAEEMVTTMMNSWFPLRDQHPLDIEGRRQDAFSRESAYLYKFGYNYGVNPNQFTVPKGVQDPNAYRYYMWTNSKNEDEMKYFNSLSEKERLAYAQEKGRIDLNTATQNDFYKNSMFSEQVPSYLQQLVTGTNAQTQILNQIAQEKGLEGVDLSKQGDPAQTTANNAEAESAQQAAINTSQLGMVSAETASQFTNLLTESSELNTMLGLVKSNSERLATAFIQLMASMGGGTPSGAKTGGIVLGNKIIKAASGYVPATSGGLVHGPGTATSDSIPAMLSNGEAVLNAKAVRQLGVNFIHSVNSGNFTRIRAKVPHFASGGVLGDAEQMTARGMQNFGSAVGNNVSVDNNLNIALVRDEQEAMAHFMRSPQGQRALVDFSRGNGKVFSRFSR